MNLTKFPVPNPYVFGGGLKDDYGFYGRSNLIEAVRRSLNYTRQNAIVLHGQRRIGKTSLLHRLGRDEALSQAHMPIFFDMSQRKGASLAHILAELSETLITKLSLDLAFSNETNLLANDRLFRQTILPEIQRILGNKRLLILFDEFDAAVPANAADQYPADTLLGYLQTLLDEYQQQLSFIFVVGQRLDLLAEGYRRLFRGARTEPVGRLNQDETFDLLKDLGTKGNISYQTEALERIWQLTKGHPYLSQLIGFEVFERLQQQKVNQATPDDVDACLDKAMEHGLGALDWFWTGFDREEQLVLAAIATLAEQRTLIDEADVDQILQDHALFLHEVGRRQAVKQLLEADFLEGVADRHYQFAVEFIRRWIVKNHSLSDIKIQFDQANPEAQPYYQEGLRNFQKWHTDEAIRNFRQAQKHDPDFADISIYLARALNAQGETEAALEEYERAYKLDPGAAREGLVELRLNAIKKLNDSGEDELILAHAHRILKIDATQAEAQKILSEIYIRRAQNHLEAFRPKEAIASLKHLIEPWPIIRDDEVSEKVRELWVNYSDRLKERKPPRLDEAREALGYLDELELMNEFAIARYNEIVLAKAASLLEKDRLEEALTTLKTSPQRPQPVNNIKELLTNYKNRQVDQNRWPQATAAFEGLFALIPDDDIEAGLLKLYHQWGDQLLKQEKFEQAIEIYQKGERRAKTSADFQLKISKTFCQQAAHHLERDEFLAAEQRYRQAFAKSRTKIVEQEAYNKLEEYFKARRQKQDWSQADHILQILSNLAFAGEAVQTWRTDLSLDQAEAELKQKHIDKAFGYLNELSGRDYPKIKELIKDYLEQQIQIGDWAYGEKILEKLISLLPVDDTIPIWHANWLFGWAKAISGASQNRDLARAYALCQQILTLAQKAEDMPLFGAILSPDLETEQISTPLRQAVSYKAAEIALEQGQLHLEQGDLDEAKRVFREMMALPDQPPQQAEAIHNRLIDYSESQIRKESWDTARWALETVLAFQIDGQEIYQLLIALIIRQARRSFKEDRPQNAFSILKYLRSNLENRLGQAVIDEVKILACEFSRLYIGRTLWGEAQQVLENLQEWLASSGERTVLVRASNIVNEEWLAFLQGKRLTAYTAEFKMTDSKAARTIEYLKKEIEITQKSHEFATKDDILTAAVFNDWLEYLLEAYLELGRIYLSTQDAPAAINLYEDILDRESTLDHGYRDESLWVQHRIRLSLALAEAYLFNNELPQAVKIYRSLLDLEGLSAKQYHDLNIQISHTLIDFSEKILDQEGMPKKWESAISVLAQFEELGLPAPYGNLRPDPRGVGAMQRVILYHIQDQLKDNQLDEVFTQLKSLPKPWPTGKMKEIIWHYSNERQAGEDWENAVKSLQLLDELLFSEHNQAHDQDTLNKLVDQLVGWGQYLEENGLQPVKAAEIYYEAIGRSRDIAQPRSYEIAVYFIRVSLDLAQTALDAEPVLENHDQALSQALVQLDEILTLREHQLEHEQQVSQVLYRHAQELAKPGRWLEVHRTLDALQDLFGKDLKRQEQYLFATWRQEFILAEIRKKLEKRQLDGVFNRLDWLKDWTDEQPGLETIWTEAFDLAKGEIDYFIHDVWQNEANYKAMVTVLTNFLAQAPTDSQLIGWLVEARCLWGKSAHDQGDLEAALTQYEEALKLAPEQEIMPISDIQMYQIETLLAKAEKILESSASNLVAAMDIYREIVSKQDVEEDTETQIRQTVRVFSQTCMRLKPPDWETAHQALAQLATLNLHNDAVSGWQRELTLAEMKAKLENDQIASALASLEKLERPWPVQDIQGIVHNFWEDRMDTESWPLAINILENLGSILAEDISVREWVIEELMDLGERLDEQGNPIGAEEAFKKAVTFS